MEENYTDANAFGADAKCGLTVLETIGVDRDGLPHRATKTWTATDDGWSKQSYTGGYKFRVAEHPLADLADLRGLIETLSVNGNYYVIRGGPNDEGRRLLAAHPGQPIRRLWNMQADGTPPNFHDVPRRWFMADIDNYPLPRDFDPANPAPFIDAMVRDLLPEAFWDADYIWQFSSSAGFCAFIKLHLWFWSTEPVGSDLLKAIVLHHAPTLDPRVCHAVQPHFIARPVVNGGVDPIARRIGWHDGQRRDVDLAALAATLPPVAERTYRRADGTRAAYANASRDPGVPLDAMGDGGCGFHRPILAESVRYARRCRDTGARRDAEWIGMMQTAIRNAPHAPGRNTGNYEDEHYLYALIESAFDRVMADDREQSAVEGSDDQAQIRELFMPRGFTRGDRGLYYQNLQEEGSKPTRVAAAFDVIGHVDDGTGHGTGVLIRWYDSALRQHTAIVARAELHGKPSDLAAPLEAAGLQCMPAQVTQLRRFLHAVQAPVNFTAVSRPGWTGASYVLPDGTVLGDRAVIMRPEYADRTAATGQAGTLEEWKHQIARYAAGNPALALALCLQFAAPLLDITGDDGGGIHFYGKSQDGKTTLLCVSASVFGKGKDGDAVQSWRKTDNGMEAAAAACNDGVLVLDEIYEVNGHQVGKIIYMLANGSGKTRMTQHAMLREPKRWNSFTLSNGEMTIVTKMAEVGMKVAAGMTVRMTDVPFQATTKHHDLESGEVMSKHLKQAAETLYGTAGRAYIARLVAARRQDEAALRGRIRMLRAVWMEAFCPSHVDSQVRSIAARFSLIGAAGELAAEWGVLPWDETEALCAAGEMFKATITARGHSGSAEAKAAIDTVGGFLAKHGDARFGDPRPEAYNAVVRDRAGFREFDPARTCFIYYIFPQVWPELCGSLEPQAVAKQLKADGFLLAPETGRHLAREKSFPNYKRHRFYTILGTITGGGEKAGEEPAD